MVFEDIISVHCCRNSTCLMESCERKQKDLVYFLGDLCLYLHTIARFLGEVVGTLPAHLYGAMAIENRFEAPIDIVQLYEVFLEDLGLESLRLRIWKETFGSCGENIGKCNGSSLVCLFRTLEQAAVRKDELDDFVDSAKF